MSCVRSYYDGGTSAGALTAGSARGLLTAKSTAITATTCDAGTAFTTSTNAYNVYDTYGNVLQTSVPTYQAPEGQTSSSSYGWIPQYTASTTTAYDATFHVLPTSVTNPLGQVTMTAYDPVFEKPNQVTEPTGRITYLTYDTLGRLTQASDNFDTAAPIKTFTYTWGAVPNQTLEQDTTKIGQPGSVRSIVSCMDGFGREIEHRETYQGSNVSDVRTDYNNRGLKWIVGNPTNGGTTIGCPPYLPWISRPDSTMYEYDPLGNVRSTGAVPLVGNAPYSQAIYNGLTTTLIDERFNSTQQITDPLASTVTVKQPGSATSTILRPTSQGYYTQWTSASPNQAHYLNVLETIPDDDATQYNDQTASHIDTQRYTGPTIPSNATINAVIFHFRWKQYNPGVTKGTGPNLATWYRSNGVDTQGPSFTSTDSAGWRNDEWILTYNPYGGLPWAPAAVNAGLEFGFQNATTSGIWNYISQAWLEVVTQPTSTINTVYQYDRLGRLSTVTDAPGNVTHISYDMAGRKRSMSDPDMGSWSYNYDAAGNLTSQTDAKNATVSLQYDSLNRLTQKGSSLYYVYDTYPDTTLCPQGNTSIGRLTATRVLNILREPCYDLRGQEVTTQYITAGQGSTVRRSYDALGQMTQLTFPDNEQVTYTYDGVGALSSVTTQIPGQPSQTILSSATFTPSGAPSTVGLGNGLTTNYTYDSRMRLTGIQTGTAQDLVLTYDDASNVAAAVDRSGTQPEYVGYSYDQLNRLTGMTVNGAVAASYGYDAIGNLTSKTESLTGMSNPTTMTLTYPAAGQPHPHAPTSTTGTPALTMTYDANGNLSTQGTSTYTFDLYGRLASRSVTGGSETYIYDASDTLVRRNNPDGSSTRYVGGVYEKSFNASGAVTGVTKYYPALGRSIAVRQASGDGVMGDLYYLLADQLGSTTCVTNALGTVVSSQKYWPYGAVRSGSASQTDKQFTGQQVEPGDSALGLYNYKARFYSTVTGRFVSADPITTVAGPLGLNRYAYVADNPLKFIDPSGHCFQGFDQDHPYDCSEKFLEQIIRCAMGLGAGCTPDVRRYVLAGMNQHVFLENLVIYGTGASGIFDLLDTLFRGVIAGGDLAALPDSFWHVLGTSDFDVSGEFFRATIFTLAYGTADIYGVPSYAMMGAKPFWLDFTFATWLNIRQAEFATGGIDLYNNEDIAFSTYVARTIYVAAFLKQNNLDVNALPWSYTGPFSQREILSNPKLGLGVKPFDGRCDPIIICYDPNPSPVKGGDEPKLD